jgi:hypothetical protein
MIRYFFVNQGDLVIRLVENKCRESQPPVIIRQEPQLPPTPEPIM